MTQADIRTEVRDYIQETSGVTGGIFTDDVLNRAIASEIRGLPSKDIYKEELWQVSLVPTTDYSDGIALPDGTVKVEGIERNDGTATYEDWNPLSGVDNYEGAIFLPYTVTSAQDIRVKIKKAFAVPANNTDQVEVPEDKMEVVIWGVVIRCYRMLLGYLRGSQSWDSVTKPGDLSIPVVTVWLREAQDHYKEIVQQFATSPRPRDIDLVG